MATIPDIYIPDIGKVGLTHADAINALAQSGNQMAAQRLDAQVQAIRLKSALQDADLQREVMRQELRKGKMAIERMLSDDTAMTQLRPLVDKEAKELGLPAIEWNKVKTSEATEKILDVFSERNKQRRSEALTREGHALSRRNLEQDEYWKIRAEMNKIRDEAGAGAEFVDTGLDLPAFAKNPVATWAQMQQQAQTIPVNPSQFGVMASGVSTRLRALPDKKYSQWTLVPGQWQSEVPFVGLKDDPSLVFGKNARSKDIRAAIDNTVNRQVARYTKAMTEASKYRADPAVPDARENAAKAYFTNCINEIRRQGAQVELPADAVDDEFEKQVGEVMDGAKLGTVGSAGIFGGGKAKIGEKTYTKKVTDEARRRMAEAAAPAKKNGALGGESPAAPGPVMYQDEYDQLVRERGQAFADDYVKKGNWQVVARPKKSEE